MPGPDALVVSTPVYEGGFLRVDGGAGPDALVVSCDEMRDHLFQMLAPKYFAKWKQRHQVHYRRAHLACPVVPEPA